MLSQEEQRFIDEYKDLIEAGDLETLEKLLVNRPGFRTKLLILFGLAIGGPEYFEFRPYSKGKSRSQFRAQSGQQIMKIPLYLKPIPGSSPNEIRITEWKGTFNPKNLKTLMAGAFNTYLSKLGLTPGNFRNLYKHLFENTDWDKF